MQKKNQYYFLIILNRENMRGNIKKNSRLA